MTYLQRKKLAFMSIVNRIKGFLRTATGIPPLTLPNCVDGNSIINYTISGESLQYGKNLITYPYFQTTKTQNGITFTDNGDGSITVNGTATANASFTLKTRTAPIRLDKRKKYTLSGCPEGGGNSTYVIGISQTDYGADSRDSGTGITFHPNYDYWYIYISVYSGVTVENLTFYPQLEEGSEATEYSLSQITPDTPIEIESVGEKSNNLFNKGNPNLIGGYISGGKLVSYSANIQQTATLVVQIEPNSVYMVSRKLVGLRFAIGVSPNAPASNISLTAYKSSNSAKRLLLTSGAEDKYLYAYFYNSNYDTYSYQELMEEIEVQKVDISNNLIPYPYSTVANPFKGVDITRHDDGSLTLNGEHSESTVSNFVLFKADTLKLSKGTYTMFCRGATNVVFPVIQINGSYRYVYSDNEHHTFTIAEDGYIGAGYIQFSVGATFENVTVKPYIVKLDVDKPYEPGGYKIPVKASGKNLCDINNVAVCTFSTYNILGNSVALTPKNTTAYYDYMSFYINDVELGGTYTVSCDIDFDINSGAKPLLRAGYFRTNKTFAYLKNTSMVTIGRHNLTFTLPTTMPEDIEENNRFVILINYTNTTATTLTDLTISDVLVELGNTDTGYEPYVEPITTNIYLGEPIRKVISSTGTYVEQLDYENQKRLNPSIVTVVLKGTENWTLRSGKTNTFQYWYGTQVNGGLCSHYSEITTSDFDILTGFARLVNTSYFYISDLNCNSVAEFKAFLKAQYDNGTPVTIITRKNSDNIIETDADLPKLPTFKGTTIYSIETNIQPSNMSATYYSTSKGD